MSTNTHLEIYHGVSWFSVHFHRGQVGDFNSWTFFLGIGEKNPAKDPTFKGCKSWWRDLQPKGFWGCKVTSPFLIEAPGGLLFVIRQLKKNWNWKCWTKVITMHDPQGMWFDASFGMLASSFTGCHWSCDDRHTLRSYHAHDNAEAGLLGRFVHCLPFFGWVGRFYMCFPG